MTALTWVFDVDGCLFDSLTGSSLRPGGRRLLEHLRNEGAVAILWSAGGRDYAIRRAQAAGVQDLFATFAAKEERGPDGRYDISHLPIHGRDAVFVDDRPTDLPSTTDVIAVRPYLVHDPYDRELEPVAERAGMDLWRSSNDG